MKFLGIPIIYIVIAVGVLGIVTYAFVSEKAPAFAEDDTLQCQRSYDFSQVKFTPEAKQDWDKCYMPQPLYERDGNGFVVCLQYPEESCMQCADVLALKYNNSDYCELIRPCQIYGIRSISVEENIAKCKSIVNQTNIDYCVPIGNFANVNHSIINDRLRLIDPTLDDYIANQSKRYGC